MKFILPWCGALLVYLLTRITPTSFTTLFLINIWLFSMPHTFSTFTRSDRRDPKKVALTLSLLMGFLISVMLFTQMSGLVLLYSVYFYWQQFHYGKQNFGLAQWESTKRPGLIDQGFYLSIVGLSLVGLLGGETQSFFGYALYFPWKFSVSALSIFFIMSAITIGYVLHRPEQKYHAIGHTLIFSFAYLFCEHFALGWLVLNVFHNLQYLKFMKSFEKQYRFLLVPIILTGTLYILQFHVFKGFILFSVPLSLGLMLALNFTHYTLDGLIWKRARTN